MKDKSAGIAVFAILFILIGLCGFLSSAHVLLMRETINVSELFWDRVGRLPQDLKYAFTGHPMVDDVLAAYQRVLESRSFYAINLVNAALSFAVVILGIGIWFMSEWARRCTIIFFLLVIPLYVWAGIFFFDGVAEILREHHLYALLYVYGRIPLTHFFTGLNLLLLIVNAAVIGLYFNRADVKRQFRQGE